MKSLVKPTTPIMLLLSRGEEVASNRPSVVTTSDFVVSKIAAGVLKLVAADLPDTATDEIFQAHWKACREDGKVNEDLAVESFLSTLGTKAYPEAEALAEADPEAEALAEAPKPRAKK